MFVPPCLFHIWFILFSLLSLFVLSLCLQSCDSKESVFKQILESSLCSLTNLLTFWRCNVLFLFSSPRSVAGPQDCCDICKSQNANVPPCALAQDMACMGVGDCRVERVNPRQHQISTILKLWELSFIWRTWSVNGGTKGLMPSAESLHFHWALMSRNSRKVSANLEQFAELHRFGRSL